MISELVTFIHELLQVKPGLAKIRPISQGLVESFFKRIDEKIPSIFFRPHHLIYHLCLKLFFLDQGNNFKTLLISHTYVVL